MSLDEFLKKEGEDIIRWPNLELSANYLDKFPDLNSIEMEIFPIPKPVNIYAVNKILSKVTLFATQFNNVFIAYRANGEIYNVANISSVIETEEDIGISDALDDWVLNKYDENKINDIIVLSNPISADSFVGYIVSDGDGLASAQLLYDKKQIENLEFTVDNFHQIDYVNKTDFKGKNVSEDMISRLLRHYSRFRGKFEFIYGLTRTTLSDDNGKKKTVKPAFFTINYTSLDF